MAQHVASRWAGQPRPCCCNAPPRRAPRNGTKLLGVGFAASMVGVVATNTLIAVRKALDPSFKTLNPPQDPLATSALYGLYMASSSNIRYQILAGVLEERIVETVLSGKPGLTTAISFILRTGNTFLGSLLWVDFVRLFGMQKASTVRRSCVLRPLRVLEGSPEIRPRLICRPKQMRSRHLRRARAPPRGPPRPRPRPSPP